MSEKILELKKSIISIGRLLWEKDLVSGLNGNISARVDEGSLLLTAHGTCLGLLQDKDILHVDLDGNVIGEGSVSTEKLLHTEIYKNFSDTEAVIHTHTTYTNAYFLDHEVLSPRIFESKIYLGEVKGIPQKTPAVTDAKPVIETLKNNAIAVLRNHGVVAMGKNLFDCFLLIQALEEASKIDLLARCSMLDTGSSILGSDIQHQESRIKNPGLKKYKLFSQEQIDEIVKLVNTDKKMKELGNQTGMTMDLAVKMDETGQVYSFEFRNGNIDRVGNDESAEFLINASENVWRAVFNQEIDPFVATTQKKMHLKGDFAKISRWYEPCSRVFELWANVPVE